MLHNLQRAPPIIFIDGAGEKRLTKDELPKRPVEEEKPKKPAGRAPARWAPPVPVPAPIHGRRHVSPPRAVIPRYVPPTSMEARNGFWGVIEKIEWMNLSDGVITRDTIVNFRDGLSERERDYFKLAFYHYEGQALANDTVKTADVTDRTEIATHITLMGRALFEQYMSDPTWTKYLIDNKDYQQVYADVVEVFDLIDED